MRTSSACAAGVFAPRALFYFGKHPLERLASWRGEKVLIIDRRSHIGGNACDRYDKAGILIHQYGPHIFHTNSQAIVDHLSHFTPWRPCEHRVLADIRGQLLPIPINRTTLLPCARHGTKQP